MTVEFAVAIADSFPTQFRFTFPTLAEAARAAVLGDYVVVVQRCLGLVSACDAFYAALE